MHWCLFEHPNTRKHAYEHSCSSVRVILSILAHLAHLAQFFFLILNGINRYMFWYVSEHANTRKHLSEHCCSSVGVFLSILAGELPRSGKNPQLRLMLLRNDIASQQQQSSLVSFTHILFFSFSFPLFYYLGFNWCKNFWSKFGWATKLWGS